MNHVLVLTNSRDGQNTTSVTDRLLCGNKVTRLDIDVIFRGQNPITMDYVNETIAVDQGDEIINLKTVDSVWFRRPYSFDFNITDLAQRSVAEKEVRDILYSLWFLLDDKKWISKPSAVSRARLKPYQLGVVKKLGFATADSIITNDPNIASEFCAGGKTVFKPIAEPHLEYDDGVGLALTTVLLDEHLAHIDLVASQPVLLQRFIDKQYEVRVTCVGDKQFAAKLSFESNEQVTDWRDVKHSTSIGYSQIEIPEHISLLVQKIMRFMGLNYAAIDFAVNQNGEYLFLEINPVGQWLWIEEATGLPISAAIANFLSI